MVYDIGQSEKKDDALKDILIIYKLKLLVHVSHVFRFGVWLWIKRDAHRSFYNTKKKICVVDMEFERF